MSEEPSVPPTKKGPLTEAEERLQELGFDPEFVMAGARDAIYGKDGEAYLRSMSAKLKVPENDLRDVWLAAFAVALERQDNIASHPMMVAAEHAPVIALMLDAVIDYWTIKAESLADISDAMQDGEILWSRSCENGVVTYRVEDNRE